MVGKLHAAIEFLEKLDRLGSDGLSEDDYYYVPIHLDAVRRAAECIEYMARSTARQWYDSHARGESHFKARNPDRKEWVDSRWIYFVEPADRSNELFQPK